MEFPSVEEGIKKEDDWEERNHRLDYTRWGGAYRDQFKQRQRVKT